jgi:CheY-like chemotaxis protein
LKTNRSPKKPNGLDRPGFHLLPKVSGSKTTLPPTALVVDDDIVIRQFIRFTLETKGWQVEEAGSATEGLERIRELRPHLVTLDLIMPNNTGLDSLDLARLLNEEAPEITLLILSSAGSNRRQGVRRQA